VTLRDKQIPATTTDQRLLDRRGPSDWVHADPWRVMRIQAEFVEGFGLLAELGMAVSVFGSARTKRDTPEYRLADEIASDLVKAGELDGISGVLNSSANQQPSHSGSVSAGQSCAGVPASDSSRSIRSVIGILSSTQRATHGLRIC